VIVVVPAAIAVTTPDATVAIEVLEEVHGAVVAAVPEPVKVAVDPIQAFNVPEIVGNGLTVMVRVVDAEQVPEEAVSV
jgi:hypothetical protein